MPRTLLYRGSLNRDSTAVDICDLCGVQSEQSQIEHKHLKFPSC